MVIYDIRFFFKTTTKRIITKTNRIPIIIPASGEINRRLQDPEAAIKRIEESYLCNVINIDNTDGLSMEFEKWRFNLRSSNTEPVLRLNVESRGDVQLMRQKTAEILSLIDNQEP